jgi:glycosyltransferase involved in cell wall biosynthesis
VKRILIDAREFVPHRFTGIGHCITGLVDALTQLRETEITLACHRAGDLPPRLKSLADKIRLSPIPTDFLKAEWMLSNFSRHGFDLFISPYPKLPLFGIHCPSVHTVHDVLDLTYPPYKKRLRKFFDKQRLWKALSAATLTWYDSTWSLEETKALNGGYAGSNPRVRPLGIDDRFSECIQQSDATVLQKYGLREGYILIVGNGSPHKNLGELLNISDRISRKLVFIGASDRCRQYWERQCPAKRAIWIERVGNTEMACLMRSAFCLAQPSLMEGYGYPPLEAMACGTPAIVSHIPVLVETTGGNALTADPGDGASWIAAFQYLENENVYQTQVEKGVRWVANRSGRKAWLQHVNDIEELLVL